MYNKRSLSKDTKASKAPKKISKPRDIITDPMGQWKYPGQNTRIPSSDITMKGVPYPVLGVGSNGQEQMMYPGQEYTFPGAEYVDEYPQMRKGGGLKSKKFSRDLEATNYVFHESPLFKKPKSKKKKIFHPKAKHYQTGGAPIPDAYNNALQNFERPVVTNSPFPGYNALANTIEQDPNSPIENVNNPWWNQHELFHHLQNTAGGMSTSGIMGQKPNPYAASDEAIHGYYNRRDNDVQDQINQMISADPSLQFIPRHLLTQTIYPEGSDEPSFVGADALMYTNPSTVEGEARAYENYIRQGGKPLLQIGGAPYNYNPFVSNEPESQEEIDAANNAMMKARLAYANMHGNTAAQRMVVAPDEPYQYTGNEYDQLWGQPVGAEPGMIGTHYMGSFGNYAVPFIQQGSNGLYFNEAPSVRDSEAIRFDNEDDAQYFGEHYKEIAPDATYREEYQDGGANLTPEEEAIFQTFYNTLPDNLMTDDPTYNMRGYWDSEGRPSEFNYNQPTEDDGYYHAYSINGNTGEYLKSPAHETFQHAVDEDRKIGYRPITDVYGRNIVTENESIAAPTPTHFLNDTTGPANYIEAELTPEEIQQYRDGGYIVEDLEEMQTGGLSKPQRGIIVNDRTDPRLLAYKDSLQIFNDMNRSLNSIAGGAYPEDIYDAFTKTFKRDASTDNGDYIGPRSGIRMEPTDWAGGDMSFPMFDKPKQPVIYQEPIPELPIRPIKTTTYPSEIVPWTVRPKQPGHIVPPATVTIWKTAPDGTRYSVQRPANPRFTKPVQVGFYQEGGSKQSSLYIENPKEYAYRKAAYDDSLMLYKNNKEYIEAKEALAKANAKLDKRYNKKNIKGHNKAQTHEEAVGMKQHMYHLERQDNPLLKGLVNVPDRPVNTHYAFKNSYGFDRPVQHIYKKKKKVAEPNFKRTMVDEVPEVPVTTIPTLPIKPIDIKSLEAMITPSANEITPLNLGVPKVNQATTIEAEDVSTKMPIYETVPVYGQRPDGTQYIKEYKKVIVGYQDIGGKNYKHVPTNLRPYKQGGMAMGDEIDLTQAQEAYLRKLGYKLERIK